MFGYSLGQTLFYGGLGLLALTMIVGVVFLLKKPKYEPSAVAALPPEESGTQPLRNSYPTAKGHQAITVQGSVSETERLATELLLEESGSVVTELLKEKQGDEIGRLRETELLTASDSTNETDLLEP